MLIMQNFEAIIFKKPYFAIRITVTAIRLSPCVGIFIGPPSIRTHPMDVNIPEGSTATLKCRANGRGTLMYSWEIGSWTLINNTNSPSYTTNRNMVVGQYTYRCVVRNEAGSVVSNSATVNVYGEYCIM